MKLRDSLYFVRLYFMWEIVKKTKTKNGENSNLFSHDKKAEKKNRKIAHFFSIQLIHDSFFSYSIQFQMCSTYSLYDATI